jgi:hypothetical protein
MHIEVTDCQRNIPTSEKVPGAKTRTAKKTARPMLLPNDFSTPETSGAPIHHKFARLLESQARNLPRRSPGLEGKIFIEAQRRRTTNFREKTDEKKPFSDISPVKNCFR